MRQGRRVQRRLREGQQPLPSVAPECGAPREIDGQGNVPHPRRHGERHPEGHAVFIGELGSARPGAFQRLNVCRELRQRGGGYLEPTARLEVWRRHCGVQDHDGLGDRTPVGRRWQDLRHFEEEVGLLTDRLKRNLHRRDYSRSWSAAHVGPTSTPLQITT